MSTFDDFMIGEASNLNKQIAELSAKLAEKTAEVERLKREIKDMREESYEVERSRNADKFSREGY
jgi:cell division protein FtsB